MGKLIVPEKLINLKSGSKNQNQVSLAVLNYKKHDLTPGRAIHQICMDCVGSSFAIKDCQGDKLYAGPCKLFSYRMGKGRPSVKLIRKYCLWCMGGSPKLVKDCHSGLTCPLFAYRLGRNPKMRHLTRRFFTRINERAVGNGQIGGSGA
jgi:hypothetical protein